MGVLDRGRKGTLSALSLVKVWALTTLNEKRGLSLSLMDIAEEVWVIGRPRRHPSSTVVEKWQAGTLATRWRSGKAMGGSASSPSI